jgi:hypothetical protein
MLAGTRDLIEYRLTTRDGELGRLSDLSFDDSTWQIRHLVVDTEGLLPHRILLHPLTVRRHDPNQRLIELMVSRRQLELSPSIDADQPLTHKQAELYYRHFGWPAYWPALGRGFLRHLQVHPAETAVPSDATPEQPVADYDPHLRSARRLLGFQVQARDDGAGRIDDVLIDDAAWTLVNMVVDTRGIWLARQVLVSPEWTERIDWARRLLQLDLDLESLSRRPFRRPGSLLQPNDVATAPGR